MRPFFLVSVSVLSVGSLLGQQVVDDPQFDHNPPPPEVQLPSVVAQVLTSEDGYDNFLLGVDLAEPHMSINVINPLAFFAAFNINNAHGTSDAYSWTSSTPAFGFPMRGDPVTAYDSLGNLYYENMYGSPSILGCKVIRSTDNGATWSASVTAIPGVDKNWIACDQTAGPYANYVYTTMTGGGGVGNFARSTDQGATWTTTATFNTQVLPGMMVAVGPNVLGTNNISGGCVYVVTHSGTNASGKYTFYRSANGGVSFTQMDTLRVTGYIGTEIVGRSTVNGMRTRPYPMIAADNSFGPFRGRLYLVYATNDPPGNGNKADIFLHYSTNQGASWSGRRRVNDDPNTINNHNFFPAIWCDKETGRLYIKWYDSRLCPTSDSMDVYATFTDDGGETFAANQRLTNRTFKTKVSSSGNPPAYQGDYDAITSHAVGALAVWTDFRNDNFGSMVGFFPDFAMLVSPALDTIATTGFATLSIRVPSVKLYSHVVRFTASISPPGPFTMSFPQGDTLTAFPDSLPLLVHANGVAPGSYTVTVVGAGPNGTPVHIRSVNLVAQSLPASITVISPNGGEMWPIGLPRPIEWTSVNLGGTIRIELSRDGGATFPEILFAGTADDGNESWLVTGPPTATARVRVASVSSPTVSDISNGTFQIVQPAIQVLAPAGGDLWSVDSVVEIRWNSAHVIGNVNIELTRDGGLSYASLFSNTPNDGSELWTVTLPYTADARIRVYSIAIAGIGDSSASLFTIGRTISGSVAEGWNMVSLPLTVGDPRVTSLLPTASSGAFRYGVGGYEPRDSLLAGEGYWVKFAAPQVVSMFGIPLLLDTIDVREGWNLIGSIAGPVLVDSIEQIPAGLLASDVYAFDGTIGYQSAVEVEPLRGYWIKATTVGTLVLRFSGSTVYRRGL